ncbi:MAG: HAD family hydrolase [Blastocatellia bacterium]|nr:HAD family hydrolase [Blastocatellia bacterium]
MAGSKRAIFLDRDGTLNEEVGYITDPAQFRLFDFAAAAVREINRAERLAIVLTNQSGIARGLYDEAFLAEIHEKMHAEMRRAGARIDGVYYCPHHPEIGEAPYRQACDCRKPKPGMILRAAREFGLDPAACHMIGDRYGDVAMAHAAGARGILLLSGHGGLEYERERGAWPREPDFIAETLTEAVRWILEECES